MYKKIFTIFALAASLLACNKVENEVVAPEMGVKTLEITASIGVPATRLAYSEAEDGSYKARFDNNDVIWAYFAKADNSVVGNAIKLVIDARSISFDGKTARFRQPAVTVPSDATKIIAYLSNTANTTNFDGGDEIVSDISSQTNLAAALNSQVVFGSVNLSDLKSTDPNVLAASIPFSYKTSLVKFSLALPEGTEVDPTTAVSVALTAGKFHNKLHISGGVLGAKSEEGDIALGATLANGVVSASAAVWAEDDLTSKINVTVGENTYFVDFKPSAAIAAGKVYAVERTLTVSPKPVTVMKNDEAGSMNFAYSGGEDVTNDWLSCKSGVVSWTANTTGAPRQATLNFKNGALCTVTQVAPADFKGSYTFYNYSFKSSGVSDTKVVNQNNRQHETAVQFKAVENPTTVNGHVHNLDLVGLYLDFAVPASFEIVDDAPVIYTYLSLDYQKVSNGTEVACIPELTNTTSYGTGYFAPLKFGVNDCNYAWIAWGVDDLLGTPKFGLGTGAQRLVSEGMYCCGFSFVVNGYKEGSYTTIYQFNYNNKWVYDETAGAGYFAKK